MLLAALTGFSIILATSGSPTLMNSRIVGGVYANSQQFPFIAQILTNGLHRCAGYIYNSNWIVTSASCVYDFNASQLKVVVGQLSLIATDPGEETFSVLTIHYHESYDVVTKKNNIAMLQVSGSITLGDFSNIGTHGDLPAATTSGFLLGWGNAGSGNFASALQYTTVPIYTNETTCPSIDSSMWNPTLMICAGDELHNACFGDAGGPLVLEISPANYLVIGIVSHSSSCFSPTAFVRLSYYSTWMQAIGESTKTTHESPNTPEVTELTTMMYMTTSTGDGSETPDVPTVPATTSATASFQTCDLAGAGQFAFVVSVRDRSSGLHICSGFIYNENYIVTTTSCAETRDSTNTVIIAGSLRLNSIGAAIIRNATQIILNAEGDIALIRVSKPFEFNSDNVKFIRYDQANYAAPLSTVVGWASTNAGGCTTSLDLLWGPTHLTTNLEECSWIPNFDAATMICAGPSSRDSFRTSSIVGSCRFENGSPLIQETPSVLVGIKSTIEESCASGKYTAYTRVSTFFSWLYQNAGPQP